MRTTVVLTLVCTGLATCWLFKLLARLARYYELSGTVFVTGATGAVGENLVSELLDRKLRVIAHGRSTEKLAKLQALGAVTFAYDFDNFDAADFVAQFEAMLVKNGIAQVNHVFLNAGSGYFGPLVYQPGVEHYVAANIAAPSYLLRYFNTAKTITLTGSCMGHMPAHSYALYSLAKQFYAGLALYATTPGLEGPAVQVVCPATIRQSGFFNSEAMKDARKGLRALGAYRAFSVSPTDVARALLRASEHRIVLTNVGWVSSLMHFGSCLKAFWQFVW